MKLKKLKTGKEMIAYMNQLAQEKSQAQALAKERKAQDQKLQRKLKRKVAQIAKTTGKS